MYNEFKDYYSLLQVPFFASAAEVKTAYRKLAREQHPDRHPEETEHYTGLFQEITEAYETLSDEEKRATYDFRYRQIVLQEGPQYEYYEDDTPQHNTVYEHKYTVRNKRRTSFYSIGILVLFGLQLVRSAFDAPPVYQPPVYHSSMPLPAAVTGTPDAMADSAFFKPPKPQPAYEPVAP